MSAALPEFRFDDSTFASAYDELLVPRFFSQWGELLLSKTGIAAGDHLLDVATGPGTLARIGARRAGPSGKVTAVDLAPPMLAVARAKPRVENGAPIEWIESPCAPLAVKSDVFDVATCQQGMQFFPDRPAAVGELFRALKPGGWVGIAVWAPIERNTLFAAEARALDAAGLGELATKIRVPFSWHAPDELRVMLSLAGFREAVLETHTLPVIFENGLEQLYASIAAMPFASEFAAAGAAKQKAFRDALARELAPMSQGPRVRGEMVSTIAVARKPLKT